jgi:hypothetical protein
MTKNTALGHTQLIHRRVAHNKKYGLLSLEPEDQVVKEVEGVGRFWAFYKLLVARLPNEKIFYRIII